MGKRSDVFVGVASIPSREASLKTVIERLLPQARQIGVYLNGYERVPGFLRHRRISVARSQHHGDLRDNGKFFFVDKSRAQFYATVDDDILYPNDYLEHLVRCLSETDQPSAMGVHGAVYPSPIVELFDPRYLIHFEDPSPHVMPVHLLGTGTALFDQSDWQLELTEFGTPGMADVWFAAAAARRGASLFVARRVRNWVLAFDRRAEETIGGALFFEGLLDSSHQVSVLRQAALSTKGFEPLVMSLLASRRFREDFSLHQAIELDLIRAQLGYPPAREEVAAEAGDILEKRGHRWSREHDLAHKETASLAHLAVDLLSDRVSASSVEPVLQLLDRLQDLARTDLVRWASLPAALKHDSSLDRVESLKSTLLERGMYRGDKEARRLWNELHGRVRPSLSAALQAERSSMRTSFERLPAFVELARESPASAEARLYDYYEIGDWRRQPDLLGLRRAFGEEYHSLDVQMLACIAAARSGEVELAGGILETLRRRFPWDRDVRLLGATLSAPRDQGSIGALLPALEIIDEALAPQGLTGYRDLILDGAQTGHWIHHLGDGVDDPLTHDVSTPTVSVLMTTFNDTATIRPAILSVLRSAGVDLQLIIVDDASTDDTLEQISAIDDPRVMIVHNDVNMGPYVSRNRALEHATGQYIAIADADDWSHPQRLWYQSSILEARPHLVASKVAHVRIRPSGALDLENHLRFVGDGPVSLMFRRWLVDHIGGFDHVRTRGDIEFLRRIMARFGEDALLSFETPLVLATSAMGSNSKRFKEASLNLYRAAAQRWHEQRALTDALYVPLSGERAPFMAPYDLLASHRLPEQTGGADSASQTG